MHSWATVETTNSKKNLTKFGFESLASAEESSVLVESSPLFLNDFFNVFWQALCRGSN